MRVCYPHRMLNNPSATRPETVVLLLSLLLGLQPLTTDMYLPALPGMTQAFGAPVSQAQLTLTALLLAFGSSQLVWGPLSDRFGRRPVLLWGLSIYVLSALACALAPSMLWLIGARTAQGVAMGAAVMVARAIVRDLYQPQEGAKVMSRALTGLGIIACLSAPVGGLMAQWLGWRSVMVALGLAGGITLWLIASRLPESAPPAASGGPQLNRLVSSWWQILRNPTFVAFCALAIASYAGLFTFLASSSFVYIQVLGLSKTQYGMVLFSSALFYISGTLLCRRLLRHLGVRRTVAIAAGLSLLAGTALGLLSLFTTPSVWTVLPPFLLYMVGHGVHQPCSQSGAVGPFPQMAGTASALNGFLMMVAAFGVGSWLGWRLDGTVLPLTQGVWFWSVVIAVVGWTLVQRHERAIET